MATTQSDKGVGLTLLLGLFALGAAAATLAAPTQALTAWGFAATMVLGVVLVAVIHLAGGSSNNR